MTRLLLLSIVLLSGTRAARAEDVGRLSDRGRMMLTGTVSGGWDNGEYLATPTGAHTRWWLRAAPSFLYFVHDRVGLGGYVGHETSRGDFQLQGIRFTNYGVSAGFSGSFEVVASGAFGLFLNVDIGYAWNKRKDTFYEGLEPSYDSYDLGARLVEYDRRVQFGFRLPLTYHLSSSVGIGLGPDFLVEFINYDSGRYAASSRRRRLGASSWIAYSF